MAVSGALGWLCWWSYDATGVAATVVATGARVLAKSHSSVPHIVTSSYFSSHHAALNHPECPDRIAVTLPVLQVLHSRGSIHMNEPPAIYSDQEFNRSRAVIEAVHSKDYVAGVREACGRGGRLLSPWDEDTYIDRSSFNTAVIAQSAWIAAVDHTLGRAHKSRDQSIPNAPVAARSADYHAKHSRMSFAVSRPPGHHATFDSSMGFCIFNFAVGAASYAISNYGINYALLRS